jgi:hypothetical protein
MKSGDNRITIELPKGLKLVAERNIDPEYQNEIYVGIETPDGIWHQDLAVIRNAYSIDDNLIRIPKNVLLQAADRIEVLNGVRAASS